MIITNTRKFVSLLVPSLVFSAVAFAQAGTAVVPSKIGVINIQGAIVSSNEGRRDFEALSKKFEPKQAELKTMNTDAERYGAFNREIDMAAAVTALPLELREPLLIVVLAGFTHHEAASALDISLSALITRLTKARERVVVLSRPLPAAAPRTAPHLRVVK